jgi:hypothetical protein
MKTKSHIFRVLLFTSCMASSATTLPSKPQISRAEQISYTDAEILVYLLPQAQELRRQGMDIGWELQTSPALNQTNFYIFWVVNSKRPKVEGSVTVGYFAVNKHTADVWDQGLEEFVVSPDVAAVQSILRRGHHIGAETISSFRQMRPEIK